MAGHNPEFSRITIMTSMVGGATKWKSRFEQRLDYNLRLARWTCQGSNGPGNASLISVQVKDQGPTLRLES